MIRKKRRTAQQRAWLKVKQTSPTGIGRTRDEEKADRDEAERIQTARTRMVVFARDATCRYCDGVRWPFRDDDQMHHDPPLSATRGLPPEVRTNTRTCGRACPLCHDELTGTIGRKMTTRFLSDHGFDGPVEGVRVV